MKPTYEIRGMSDGTYDVYSISRRKVRFLGLFPYIKRVRETLLITTNSKSEADEFIYKFAKNFEPRTLKTVASRNEFGDSPVW